MGGKNSREAGRREFSSYGSGNSSAWDQYNYPPQSPYVQQYPYTEPSEYGSQTPQQPQRRLDRKYSRIADNYQSLDEVTAALIKAGLESSNLIVGIDFTKSNEWTGSRSFNRRSLHHIGNEPNPYEQAISIIGQTLSSFDDDNMIPCFGFGDASTHDQDVFSFYHDDRICNGFEEVLHRYREIVPDLRLAGPTSFAPIIEMAMTIVDQTGGQYHVLLIIADGQVTRSVDTHNGQLSLQERKTIDAIVRASEYPLSIVLVGVGDGPWDTMKEFDDNIPARAFDNFQFVNFTEMMSNNVNNVRRHADFCLAALMEIPSQYQATLELGILGYAFTLCNLRFNGLFVEFINAISLLLMSRRQIGSSPERVPLPPPLYSATSSSGYPGTPRSNSFQTRTSSLGRYNQGVGTNPSSSSSYDNQVSNHFVASN